MRGKRTVFTTIKSLIEADSTFKQFDLFFDQFRRHEEGAINSIKFPACFAQFTETEWISRVAKHQQGQGVVTLHLGDKWQDRDATRILTLEERLAALLHGHQDENVQLERIREGQGIDYEKTFVWSVDYHFTVVDNVAMTTLSPQEPPITLEVDETFTS